MKRIFFILSVFFVGGLSNTPLMAQGGSCITGVDKSVVNFGPEGGTQSIVITPSGCTDFQVSNNAPWFSWTKAPQSNIVYVDCEVNNSGTGRSGVIIVGGIGIPVNQSTNCPLVGSLGEISGSLTSCRNSTASYSVPSLPEADTYSWSVTGGTITNGQGSRVVDISFSSGSSATISVVAENNCGNQSNLSSISVSLTACGGPLGDRGMNWILSQSYDENEEVITSAKVFFDERGKQLQSQSKLPNDGGGFDVFATQPVYDRFDRPVVSSMSGRLNATDFIYTSDFVKNSAGEVFTYEDINDDYEGSSPTGSQPVGQASGLGWYYSDNNSREPLQATTDYPYALTQYYDDGTGEVKRSAGPGDQLRMGQGHEVYSKTFPLLQELDDDLGTGSPVSYSYLSIRNTHVFTSDPISTLEFKGVKTVSIDQNGAEVISITDENGNVLATATSNPYYNKEGTVENDISVTLAATVDNENLTALDFHVPNNGDLGSVSGAITASFTGGSGNYTLYNLKADHHKIPLATSSAGSQSLSPSFYRLTGEGHRVSYTATYYNWTYNFYDTQGRLVVSISPNGVKALKDGEAYADIDKTTYQYNYQGWLLSMTEPDAGTTQYIYRKDGAIRFSQNEKQLGPGSFSYTKYDQIGRPIESGEYTGGTAFDRSGLAGYLEEKGYDAFPSLNTDQELFTFYDFPDNATFNTVLTDDFGYCPLAEDQTYMRGAVSFTRNDHMKTWYSYDEFGQVRWMIQKPTNLDDYFHIEYEYDYFGNVTQVKHYRKRGEEELDAFYHHYSYDVQQRLKEVHASEDGTVSDATLQARYFYYLHGPLKRVELGADVENAPVARQGIDYVYTLQGWLKSINHPEAGKDPGQDDVAGTPHADFSEDLFAMTIEYFNGDYVRSGSPLTSVNSTAQPFYNGNIGGITWRTGGLSTGATPVMYAYDYDNSYQLKGATFGTPDYTAQSFTDLGNQYKVRNLAYDPNGNIQSLVRYGGKLKDGGDYEKQNNFLDYTYYSNKNKLDSIQGYADYDYNEIGQLTEEILRYAGVDSTDITRTITYDVSGKVTNVNFVGQDESSSYNKNAEYVYDDRGFRLMKKDPDGKETWYIRDAGGNVLTTYEKLPDDEELEIKETMIYGSGRIGMYKHDFLKLDPDKGYIAGDEYRNEYEGKDYELLPGASMTLLEGFIFEANGTGTFEISTVVESEVLGATQYELTDHLGNVRVATTQERTSVNFFTGMETEEGGGFENATETRHLDVNYNHTAGGSYSCWLNNAVNGQAMGPAITLSVNPGDTVRMSAYGMYRNDVGTQTGVINTLISALAGSFTGAPGLEAAEIASQFAQLPAAITGAGVAGQGSVPKAYLKYIIFDKDFNVVNVTEDDTDVDELTTAAHNGWEKLQMEVPITKNGYIYIYTANESTADVDVFFDDIEVQLVEGPMTSASDYYPFGLVMDGRSWTSEPYRFGYQGQFAEKDEETGWNAFEARMYSSEIGRWLTIDAARQYASPYLGMGNNPINGVDPDGNWLFGWFGSTSDQRQTMRQVKRDNGGQIKNFWSESIHWLGKGHTYEVGKGLFGYNYYSVRADKDGNLGPVETMPALAPADGIDPFYLGSDFNDLIEAGANAWEGNWLDAGGSAVAVFLPVVSFKTVKRLWNSGPSFSQYRRAYWSEETKPIFQPIRLSNGDVFAVRMELHHRFIPQRASWAPNWLKNNRFNLQPLNTIQHAMKDRYRFQFLPKEIKIGIMNGNTFGY